MDVDASHEQHVQIGDVELCYETFGDRSNPPLLLVMGLRSRIWPTTPPVYSIALASPKRTWSARRWAA